MVGNNTHRNLFKSADLCFITLQVQRIDIVSDRSGSLALWSLNNYPFLKIKSPWISKDWNPEGFHFSASETISGGFTKGLGVTLARDSSRYPQ